MSYLKEFQSFILKRELKKKQLKNPAFSMRSFALKLGISPSSLSRVLKQDRALSRDIATSIVFKLNLSKREAEYFIHGRYIPKGRPTVYEHLKRGKSIEMSEDEFINSYIVFHFDPQKIPLARELVRRFLKDFYEIMESDELDSLYECNIQLFSHSAPTI